MVKLVGYRQYHVQQTHDDLVFAHPHLGVYYVASTLLDRYKDALDRAGVRRVRFHDLRHAFATTMAAQGVPMRTLQAWMGHADIQTTMIYADYASDATNGRDWVNRAFSGLDRSASSASGRPSASRVFTASS